MSGIVPGPIRATVESRLGEITGSTTRIVDAERAGGGCISPGARIVSDTGDSRFLKWAAPGSAPPAFFAEEARSLRELGRTGHVRVPAVLAVHSDWLLLEWLEPGLADPDAMSILGRQLARLHRVSSDAFGWTADNWIGSLPQTNASLPDWPSFWRERRILPQWEAARRRGFFGTPDQRGLDRLAAALDSLLEAGNMDGPSLLHGDLWGGNVHTMADGTAALIDPSSSWGHREVDLAMASLFGGFGSAFFERYENEWPLEPGFAENRCPLYQLYYLLVHVNLFGASYVGQCRSILKPFR